MLIKTVRPIFILALLAPLLSSCLFSPPEKPPPVKPPVEYLPYTSRENLIENFVRSWEARDASEYRDHILFNSTTDVTADGEDYQTFIFYFAEGNDIWGNPLPTIQTYEEEKDNITRMFSGNPGQGPDGKEIPGVASIDLELTMNQTWTNPPNPDQVEGDPYPEGTKRAIFATAMTILLKGTIPDSDITGFTVDDLLEFHVIPVVVGLDTDEEHTEYRLWKWRDLFNGEG